MKRCLMAVSLLVAPVCFAQTGSVDWSTRQSRVVCGGRADGVDLDVQTSVPNELLKATTGDGRLLVFIDLHKQGQVRFAISEGISDSDFEAREVALAKLSSEEAALLRRISAGRVFDLYMGMTEGFVTLRTTSNSKIKLDLSCQEIPVNSGLATE